MRLVPRVLPVPQVRMVHLVLLVQMVQMVQVLWHLVRLHQQSLLVPISVVHHQAGTMCEQPLGRDSQRPLLTLTSSLFGLTVTCH